MRVALTNITTLSLLSLLFTGCLESEEPSAPGETFPVVACTDDGACPQDASCLDGLCLPECEADADCPSEAACFEGVCEVAAEAIECAASADCPIEATCVEGLCLFRDPDAPECHAERCDGGMCLGGEAEVCDSATTVDGGGSHARPWRTPTGRRGGSAASSVTRRGF